MQPRIRGIFFDEGGTLILGASEAFNSLAEEASKKYGLEGFKEALDKEFDEVFSRRSRGGHKFYCLREINVEAIQRALSRFVEQTTLEEVRSLSEFFYAELKRVLYPHPEATEVLTKLKEMKFVLGVVSNHDTKLLYEELEKAGLLGFLDVIVSSEEAKAYKPSPKPFLLALHKAKLAANQAMYVGDRYEIDVVGAKSAGVMAVLIKERPNPNPNMTPAPDHLVTALGEVYKLAIRLR